VRKLLFMAALVCLAAFLMGGATLAWFTSQDTNEGNEFIAGTVKITAERNLGDPIPGPMFYTTREQGNFSDPSWPDHATGQWYPGKTETRQLVVYNQGSLHVKLNGLSAEVTGIDDPALAQAWAEKMNVKVFVSSSPGSVLFDGTLDQLLEGQYPTAAQPFLGAQNGSNLHLSFEVEMDTSAGNALQGLEPVVSFSVYAIQA